MQFPSTQRYEIRGVLGRGGAGVVYEAHDTQSQALVALKTIETLDGESLYRLKREFRLLADVQHKHLVRLGELSCEGERWFFTMQLVRGQHFVEYVRPGEPANTNFTGAPHTSVRTSVEGTLRPGPLVGRLSFDEARLRSALVQVVQALSALHDAGYLHRDVKPSNILVTDEGQVVLLDFGLSQLIRQTASTGESLGTPAYVAPEAIESDAALGPAADWYSVGVMLYKALTGKLPFSGSTYEVMEAKMLRAPPSPRFLAPDAPADLLALCEDLLQVEPDQRPSGSEILRRLGERSEASDPYGLGDSDADAPFVGRASELTTLTKALAAVQEGQPRSVVVEGEAGVGKSTAVAQFLGMLGPEVVVLSGRCYEQENVPFKGIDSIIDALTERLCALPDDEVNKLLVGGVRYLSALFPVLTRVDAVRQVVPAGGQVFSEGALRELATGELERLLDALARRSPLVMFVDDLQWADSDGLELMSRVLLRPERAPALFVATQRPVAQPSPGHAALLSASERVKLDVLSEAESHTLWNALGTAVADLEPAVRETAVREAAGHPLFLAELALAATAGRKQKDGQLRLQDVLWDRVNAREPFERRFLEMLAVAGAPTAYEVIARAAGLSVGECLTRLGGLKAAQLVRISRRGDERAVELYHDRLREAIAERRAAPEQRDQLNQDHLRLGTALRDSAPKEVLSQRIYAIVHHLGVARALLDTPKQRTELAELYLLACRTARLETAFAKARDYARAGLDLLGDAGWKEARELTLDLTVQLMATEYLTGRAQEARACFDAALAQLTAIQQRVSLYATRIWQETSHGHFAEALGAGRAALQELGTPLPGHATLGHVLAQFAEYRLRQGRRTLDDLINLPTLESPRLEGSLDVLASMAAAAYLTDDMLHGWIRLRIANLSLKHGVSKVSAMGFAGLGLLLAGAFDKYTEAAASLRLALKLNARFKNDALAPELLFLDGHYVSPWTERFSQGVAQLKRASELAAQQGNTAIEGYGAAAFALTSYQEGTSLAELAQLSERALAITTHRGMADMAAVGKTLGEYAAILRGLAADDPKREPASGTQGVSPWMHNQCAAELAFLADDLERAERFAREATKRAPLGVPTTIELLLLNILIAGRRFDRAPLAERPRLAWALVKQLRKLRSCAQSCPDNFESYYLIGLGELLRIGGRARNADQAFARAAESARAQGALKREALALELAARSAVQQGDANRARALQERADDAYRRWGAVIKVQREEPARFARSAA